MWLVVPEQLNQVLALMVDPRIKIVTLTVTEKGYCQGRCYWRPRRDEQGDHRRPRQSSGATHCSRPAQRSHPLAPRRGSSAVYHSRLRQPAAKWRDPARRIVIRFAELRDQDLGKYIADNISFPCTMVDRITPATQDEDRKAIADGFGVEGRLAGGLRATRISVSNRKQGTSGNPEEPLGTAGNRVLGT
jgi:fructuronate reductase